MKSKIYWVFVVVVLFLWSCKASLTIDILGEFSKCLLGKKKCS